MTESFLHSTAIFLYVWVLIMMSGTIYQYRFYKYLEKNHVMIWEDVGRPTILSDRSLGTAWPTVKYMKDRCYADLADSRGVEYCDQNRKKLLYWFWASAASAVIFACFLFGVGLPPAWE